MSVNAKMKKICDNIRLRTGDTALLNLDEIADAVLTIDGAVNTDLWVSQSVAATFPPVQKAASPDVEGYDIDVLNATADDIHAYIDEVVKGKRTETVTVPAVVGFVYNERYSQSGGSFSSSTTESSVIIPVEISSAITSNNPVTLEIKGGAKINSGRSIYYGSTNSAFAKTATATITSDSGKAIITGMEAGKWFIIVTVVTNSTGVSNATTVPNMSVVFGDKTITKIAIGNTSATHETSTTTEVETGKNTVTKEILGKDASGKYDVARYIYANREHIAWVKKNYPKMYAWKNGTAKMYTESVSPRVGDKAYAEPRIIESSTTTETVTVPAQAALVEGYRWSGSGKSFSQHTASATLIVPTASVKTFPTTITLFGMTVSANYSYVYGGNPVPTDGSTYGTATVNGNTVSMTSAVDCLYFMVNRKGLSGEYDNAKVVLNGKEINVVISSTTDYLSNVKEESTTTTEIETEGGTPVTEVRVATVASGAATNTVPSSRMIGGVEYVRSAADDVEPTVIYTDVDDNRNSSASITQEGVTYYRYPLGDLGENRQKLIPIFIYANEHGIKPSRLNESDSMYQKYETKMAALVVARFLRDLADGKKIHNPLYKFIREKCMLIVIPVSNPFGYNMNVTGDTNPANDGYYNANNVNSNRNFDTPGWIISKNGGSGHHGDYPGSENETQYLMNTMVESGAVVAMSLHGIAGFFGGIGQSGITNEYGHCSHQGQNPDGSHYDKVTMDKISNFLAENYGYKMVYYDRLEVDHVYDYEPPSGTSVNLPDRACKSPSYITQCGAYGGIVEFQPDDIHVSGYQQAYKGYIIENAYAQMLNLTAMWLSDYLDQ